MFPRVLVADDDPEVCSLIRTVLRNSYEIVVCHDAESALVQMRSGTYDALISDFMLPGISGLELIALVRADRLTANVPILMISGHNRYANYGMDARAMQAGADAFLNKPFAAQHLRLTLESLMERRTALSPPA